MTARRADVARLAGISPAVVSYVLNGGPRGVSPRARARVLAAVEELGYRPNDIARSLRMNRTMTFGLVVPDTANPYFAELARAIEEEAFRRGYTLLIGNAAEVDDRQTAYVRTFLARRVDGLFLVPAHGRAGCVDALRRATTPWLTLDRQLTGLDAVSFLVDNRAGARAATEHLLEHGRTRVACIAGPADVTPATERVAGWRDALAASGVQSDEMSVNHGAFGRQAGYQAARDMLTSGRYDSVFVASDEQAVGVLRAVSELGLQCPRDVAIASFDGIAESAFSVPGLTTMAQPLAAIAGAAVEWLVDQLDGAPFEPRSVIMRPELVLRGSCGCGEPAAAGAKP